MEKGGREQNGVLKILKIGSTSWKLNKSLIFFEDLGALVDLHKSLIILVSLGQFVG